MRRGDPGRLGSHPSSIFTEVRSYTYLEVRSADMQPEELVMAVPSFWTGLLYDDAALDDALELGRPFDSPAAWRRAMDAAWRDRASLPSSTASGSTSCPLAWWHARVPALRRKGQPARDRAPGPRCSRASPIGATSSPRVAP